MGKFPLAYLNSNDGSGMLAFGEGDTLICNSGNALEKLQTFIDEHPNCYIFGYLGYDLKNEIEDLKSENNDCLNFPDMFFWAPKYVVKMSQENYSIIQGKPDTIGYDFINNFMEEETDQNFHPYKIDFTPRTTKNDYLKNVEQIQQRLKRGDIYEMNYCQEFFAENVEFVNSTDAYFKLNKITKAPFSSFIEFDDFSIFSGSPERFLKKEGEKLISQPIKGTNKKLEGDANELQKEKLKNDPKEQSENIMIVDLVRNDFSKIAEDNSVIVDELCAIYTFEHVNQMISTISCKVPEKMNFTEIIRATFPMGSMTGAPKISAMKIAEEIENFKRGVYSGSIGYIKPNCDFDFNVVIRSLLYNSKNKYLSCSVGGAITVDSIAEQEYEECMTKVGHILNGMNEQ